ncbi:MAG: right-handed parallel beta-helix repeat-containing protein, partial [Candidatus Latescibacteria bacterium]|nr:right-handed parallel beta-helix repeat-containing protein [Candidatus Latescibacterota bacterium]
NTCDSNNEDGIFLFSSGDNTISGNTCDSNNDNGIYLSSSGDNMVSGNTCPNNGRGIHLLSSDDNTISGNTCSDNNHQGIYLSSSSDNSIFLNEFFNNTTNVYSDGETNIWHSPTKLGYHYGGSVQTCKSTMGNSYSDYSGSDGDGDGIGESPYTTGGADDAYPLVQSTDNHDPQMWVLANPVMYKGDFSKPGTTVSIPMSSSQTWCADSLAQADVFFDAGDESDSTSWTGQVSFTSTPIAGDNFTVEVGYADDQNGANFWADGPDTTIVGDGSTKVFTYAAHAISFTLPQNKYLALRVTNESVSNGYDVRVGGSWSYCASPLSATPSEAPAGLGATAYPDSVRLNWNANAEPDLDYYVVYRKMSEGEPDSISTVSAPDTTYLDVNVTTGKSYYYRIRAVDHAGRERGYSNE